MERTHTHTNCEAAREGLGKAHWDKVSKDRGRVKPKILFFVLPNQISSVDLEEVLRGMKCLPLFMDRFMMGVMGS